MRPWVKLWASRLSDVKLLGRGAESALAYFRFVVASDEGSIERSVAEVLIGKDNLESLLSTGALILRDACVTDASFLREQRTNEEWESRSRSASIAAHASHAASSRRHARVRPAKEKEKEIETEKEKENQSSSEAKPPRVSNFKKALNRMAEKAGTMFLPIPDGVDVDERQAVRFNKGLWQKYRQDSPCWPLLGEWLAAGGHRFGNALTPEDILKHGASFMVSALSWDRGGRPAFDRNGYKPPHKSSEPWKNPEVAAYDAEIARKRAAGLLPPAPLTNGKVPHVS